MVFFVFLPFSALLNVGFGLVQQRPCWLGLLGLLGHYRKGLLSQVPASTLAAVRQDLLMASTVAAWGSWEDQRRSECLLSAVPFWHPSSTTIL